MRTIVAASESMEDRLQLGKGGPPVTELLKVDETVFVRRHGARLLDSLFLLVPLVLGIPVMAGLFVGFGLMLWIFFTEARGLALLVAVVFGFALLPAAYAYLRIQGILLPFKAILTEDRYRLANGLIRLSRRIRPEAAQITVFPTYSRGGWGYGAKLQIPGNKLALPLVPKCIVGTKHDALQEAVMIRDWLQKNSTVADVILEEWGDIHKIQPGGDYIK